jgi:hypothetical protein
MANSFTIRGIRITLCTFALSSIALTPVASQSVATTIAQGSSLNQCNTTLRAVKSRIKTGRDTSVDSIRRLSADNGYPRNRPVMLQLRIGGSAGSSIMSSPQFMRSISTGIINSCSDVSAVQFNLNQTGWTDVFGLIGEKVENFKCYDAGTPYPGWGYQVCGL